MNPNLPALINIVSDWHWSVWVLIILLVVVAIVIEGLWRYNRSISKTTDHDYTNSVQTNLATGSVIANKISNSPISIQYQTEPTKLSPPPQPIRLKSDPRAYVHQENRGISVDILPDENDTVACYCIIGQIELDGIVNDGLLRRITEHTARVSWSGGANGDEKHIDAGGRGVLNLVTIDKSGLKFQMQKGPRDTGPGYGFGKYKVELVFHAKTTSQRFEPRTFNVSFKCYESMLSDLPQNEKLTHVQHGELDPKTKNLNPQRRICLELTKEATYD